MKIFRVYLAFLIGLSICSTSLSRPSLPVIIECPACKAYLLHAPSGCMPPPPVWTDDIVNRDQYPLLAECPECGDVFLPWDAKRSERPYYELTEQQRAELIKPVSPSESKYLTYIKQNRSSLTKEQEIQLRKCVWRVTNDPYREDSSRPFRLSTTQKDNLEQLALLLNEQDYWQRFTKADIYRQLGHFRKCRDTIWIYYGSKQQQELAQYIDSLAAWRVKVVKRIPWGNFHPYGLKDHFKAHPLKVSTAIASTILVIGLSIISFCRHRKKRKKMIPNQRLEPTPDGEAHP